MSDTKQSMEWNQFRRTLAAINEQWEKRAEAMELPKKGKRRENDRLAFFEGALKALVLNGDITEADFSKVAFFCMIGRLDDLFAEAQRPDDSQTADTPQKV